MALRSSSGDMEASICLLDASSLIALPCSGRGARAKRASDRVCATVASADPHRLLHVENEDLAVADPACPRRLRDCFDHVVDKAVLDHHLDLHLGKEVDDVLG